MAFPASGKGEFVVFYIVYGGSGAGVSARVAWHDFCAYEVQWPPHKEDRMAPHYVVLAVGLTALGFMQALVYLEKRRRKAVQDRRPGVRAHTVGPRLQRMP